MIIESTTAIPAWVDTPAARSHFSALSDQELDALLARLLAHRSASISAVANGLAIWLFRRTERAAAGDASDALTPDQQACEDVIDLEDQVYDGGFDQWIGNAYAFRGMATVRALEVMGANRVATVVRKALEAIPDAAVRLLSPVVGPSPILPSLDNGYPSWPEFDVKTERRLHRLDMARRPSCAPSA